MKDRNIFTKGGDQKWKKRGQLRGDKGSWLPYYPGPTITPFRELHRPTMAFKRRVKEVSIPLYFIHRNYLYCAELLSNDNITITPGSGEFSPGYDPIPPDDTIHFDFLPPEEGFPLLRFGNVQHVMIGSGAEDFLECHTAGVSGATLYFCADQKHLQRAAISNAVVDSATVEELAEYYNKYIAPEDRRCMRLFPIPGGIVAVERYRIKSDKPPDGRVPHETILTPEAEGEGTVPQAVLAWQTYWHDAEAYEIQCTEQQEFLSVYQIIESSVVKRDGLGSLGIEIEQVDLGGGLVGTETKSNYAKTLYPAIEGTVNIENGAILVSEESDFLMSVYSSMADYRAYVLLNCDGIGKVYESGAEGYSHVGFYRIEDNYGTDTIPGYSMTDIANLVQVI